MGSFERDAEPMIVVNRAVGFGWPRVETGGKHDEEGGT